MSQRANKPKGESAWHMGRTSQGRKSQGENQLGGERARERTGQGVNQQRGKKAIIHQKIKTD